MKIALGQINSTVADFTGNCEKILAFTERAVAEGADMIVFPELAVCGYPPLDLMTYPAFIDRSRTAVESLLVSLPHGIAVALGHIGRNQSKTGKAFRNTVSVLYNGRIVHSQHKTLLPTYDVFDEDRYFEPASERKVFDFMGLRIGFAVCEDIWAENIGDSRLTYHIDPVKELGEAGVDLLITPSASPFYSGKTEIRRTLVEDISRRYACFTLYVNAVGANDLLIFDGNSLTAAPGGDIITHCSSFMEDMQILDTGNFERVPEQNLQEIGNKLENLEKALILGVSDYMRKNGFSRVNLGLSGGIDSALVAVIAAEAMGPENVHAYAMPSRYSSDHSLTDAVRLAQNLGIGFEVVPIEGVFSASLEALKESFAGTESDLTEENIQARIRGLLLMAWSNKKGSLLLTTGNKSEMAVGYCTLYGDMAGSLAVIGDLFKTEVFELCRYINRKAGYALIPENILTKPPSAELRPDQKDEDSLPPYDILDGILKAHIMECKSFEEIIALGYEPDTVRHIIRLTEKSEYKRRQAAIVLKVSEKAFGYGRRIPIARAIYETASH
jgi:NAD+ synthase (glutamine-hydrolysing)